MKLSAHFTKDEFNDPSTGTAIVDMRLVNALEELRTIVGQPIKILSGYRSPAHNKEVGGTSGSLHTVGRAADITVPGRDLLDLYAAVGKVNAFVKSGTGLYPKENFVHVDIGRDKPARWARVNGVYVSITDGILEYKRLHKET